MVEIELTVTEEQAEELRQSAWGRGLSVAAYVVAIHRAVLEAGAMARQGRQTMLGTVLGHTDFTARDVAVNHDEYWAMAILEDMTGSQPVSLSDDQENDGQPTE
ncbi:hypothetical protein LLH23_10265 [bacterium]|nr:hypothetical protein [bacterium]